MKQPNTDWTLWDIWAYGQGVCERLKLPSVTLAFHSSTGILQQVAVFNANWR